MKRFAVFAGSMLGLFILSGCGERTGPGERQVQRPPVRGVTVETVRSSAGKDIHEIPGTIRAINTSMISAKLMGTVKRIPVTIGQRVKKNDILLEIDSPDIGAKVRGAREAVEQANRGLLMSGKNRELMERTFERYEKLFEGKAITRQQFDEIRTKKEVALLEYEMAENSLKRAEAGLQEAAAFMDYSVIRSPFDGIVADKKIDVGSMAMPSMLLFTIEEPEYRVEVPVNEMLVEKIKTGMEVEVVVDSLQSTARARVSEIEHQIDPGSRTFMVKADLGDHGLPLRGGLYCKVRFPIGEKSRLLVPAGAVIHRGQMKGIFVVNGQGVLMLRFIRTGEETDHLVEVLSGLKSGETIVAQGVEKAVDGGIIEK